MELHCRVGNGPYGPYPTGLPKGIIRASSWDPYFPVNSGWFWFFQAIFIKHNICIYGNWVGMTAEWSRIFLKVILVLETSSKINFGPRNWNFQFFEIFIFQFSSITHFLSHKFQDTSCRICSYGPHGPFWFSVIFGWDMEKRYQKNQNREKWIFEITVKMNWFCGGKFSKAILC